VIASKNARNNSRWLLPLGPVWVRHGIGRTPGKIGINIVPGVNAPRVVKESRGAGVKPEQAAESITAADGRALRLYVH
jgi:hypothetical protein